MRSLLIIAIAISCMFFSCEKQGYGPVIKGKLVYTSCASAVVQVLDPSQYYLTQGSWQQSPSSPVYNNVFAVKNQCAFKRQNLAAGDVFYFQLTDNEEKDCVICMMWDNPPTVVQKIVVVSK